MFAKLSSMTSLSMRADEDDALAAERSARCSHTWQRVVRAQTNRE